MLFLLTGKYYAKTAHCGFILQSSQSLVLWKAVTNKVQVVTANESKD